MTTIPAVVTIPDLPTGTTITGAELLEAVQTASGVANSIQVPISQIMTTALGALPTAGNTGQFLQSGGTGFVSAWANIASNVLASTGLAQSGSTTVSLSLASMAGLSVLGVGGTGSAVPAAITGTGAQVLVVNDAGSAVNFGAVNLGSAAAVTGVLPGANMSATNLAASGAGGVQGFLPQGNIGTAAVGTAQISTTGGAAGKVLAIATSGAVQWQGGMVLLNTITPNGIATAADTTSLTSTYRNYMVTLENVTPANNNVIFQLQVATTGTAFVSGGYVSMVTVDSAAIVSDVSTTTLLLSGTRATTTVGNSTTYGVHGSFQLFNPASTTFRKTISGQVTYLNGTTSGTANLCLAQIGGYFDGNNNAIGAIQFSFSGGNIATGTIRIYGMA